MMEIFTVLLKVCILLSYTKYSVSDEPQSTFTALSRKTLSEDGKLNFTQLATKYGHSAEKHEVITEDGYILTLFHLPGEKPPVLLFHGSGDSADTFIIRGKTSMAISLAEEGYDVWVGNNRGNKFGRRHVNLDPDTDDQFWDYSFHEIGFFDLAAIVDFIRNKTGQDSIATIGHSQATTAHFVLGATRPEYNSRIKLAINMAPAAFFNHMEPPVSLVFQAWPVIATLLKSLGVNELLQDQKAASNLITLICSSPINFGVCDFGVIFPISGYDRKRLEQDFLDHTAIGHFPSATSRKNLDHFVQIRLRRSFSQYDYGVTANFDKYGTENPPDYDLNAVTMNVALLIGNNDQLSRVKDVEHLRDSLPNVVHYEVLEPKLWSHTAFVWASDMPKYLYPTIFKLLKEYN